MNRSRLIVAAIAVVGLVTGPAFAGRIPGRHSARPGPQNQAKASPGDKDPTASVLRDWQQRLQQRVKPSGKQGAAPQKPVRETVRGGPNRFSSSKGSQGKPAVSRHETLQKGTSRQAKTKPFLRAASTAPPPPAPSSPSAGIHDKLPRPSDSTVGPSDSSAPPDLEVRSIGLWRGRRNPATGGLMADTSLSPIDLTSSHLIITIRNRGLGAFEGDADLRMLSLYAFTGDSFHYDKTLPVRLSLKAGQQRQVSFPLAQSPWGRPENPGEKLQWGFVWPDPIDYPKLTFAARIDASNSITESNEQNNFLQKEIAIPCGVRVQQVADTRNDKKVGEVNTYRSAGHICLWGQFGDRQACKHVYLERNGQRHRLDVEQWTPSKLHVHVPKKMKEGKYDLSVYTTDPSANPAYGSAPIPLRISKYHDEGSWGEEELDPRDLANALAEEYEEWLEFNNGADDPDPAELWIERAENGLPNAYLIHCKYRGSGRQHKVKFSVYRGSQSVFSRERTRTDAPDADPNEPGIKLVSQYVVLQPGDYVARFTMTVYNWEKQTDEERCRLSRTVTAAPKP